MLCSGLPFSPRYTPMMSAVMAAAERCKSPVIVQIFSRELEKIWDQR